MQNALLSGNSVCVANTKHFPDNIYYSIFVFMQHLIANRIVLSPLHTLALIEKPVTQAHTHTSSQKSIQGRMCERAATDYTNERACSHVMHARTDTHIHILVDTFLHARVGGVGKERTAGRKQKLPLAFVFLLSLLSLSCNE